MKGKVNANSQATVQFRIQGQGNTKRIVTAIIDTGYDGAVTLPPAIIHALRLRRLGKTQAELADGKIVDFDVYAGLLEWDGRKRIVQIYESNTDPLIGMELLQGFELNIRVKPRGAVTITRLK